MSHPPDPCSDPRPAAPPGWRAVAGNSLWLLLEKVARWALGLTVGAWTARYLGPAGFGLYNSTLAWAALFAGAAGLGLEPIIVRELVRRPAERADLLTTAFVLRLLGGGLASALALLAAAAWPTASPPLTLVAIASLITLFALGEVFDLWFQAQLQSRTAALARTSAFVAACLGRLALIAAAAPVSAFLWLAVAEAALASALLAAIFLRRSAVRRGHFSRPLARELLHESWPNLVGNLASMGYLRADRVMLAALDSEAAAGRYSAAATLVEIWYIFPLAIINSATPLLTRLHASDPARYLRELARLARVHAVVAWTLAAALAAVAPWLVPALFGPAYATGSTTLQLLAFSLPFAFLGVAASPWYLNARLTRVAMRRHLLGGALNLALNALFIPRWGAPGAAAATLLAFATAHVFTNALDPRTRPLLHLQLRALALLPARSL